MWEVPFKQNLFKSQWTALIHNIIKKVSVFTQKIQTFSRLHNESSCKTIFLLVIMRQYLWKVEFEQHLQKSNGMALSTTISTRYHPLPQNSNSFFVFSNSRRHIRNFAVLFFFSIRLIRVWTSTLFQRKVNLPACCQNSKFSCKFFNSFVQEPTVQPFEKVQRYALL